MPLTRAWGAKGCDEAGWGETESQPEAGACVLQCPRYRIGADIESIQHIHSILVFSKLTYLIDKKPGKPWKSTLKTWKSANKTWK